MTTHARQQEGIAAAKVKGKHLGRPKAEYPDNWDEVYSKWVRGELTAVAAMQLLSVKKSTFYKLVRNFRS